MGQADGFLKFDRNLPGKETVEDRIKNYEEFYKPFSEKETNDQVIPLTEEARKVLLEGVEILVKQGVQVIILGCTEIPLGLPERKIGETFFLDPGLILARALIREFCPKKLLPWTWEI